MGRFLEILSRTAMMVPPRGESYLLECILFYTLFLSVRALLRPCLDISGVAQTEGFHEMRIYRTTVKARQRMAVIRVEIQPLVGRQNWFPTPVALQKTKQNTKLDFL